MTCTRGLSHRGYVRLDAWYEFHYSVGFDVPLRENEKDEMRLSLLELAKPYAKETHSKGKTSGRHIRLEKDRCMGDITLTDSFNVRLSMNKPTRGDIKMVNEMSNRLTGFVAVLPNRSIRSVRSGASSGTGGRKNPIPFFIERGRIVDFSSKLKLNIRPMAVAFTFTRDGSEFLAMLGHLRKEHPFLLSFDRKGKDAPWDVVEKSYQELGSLANRFNRALGGTR